MPNFRGQPSKVLAKIAKPDEIRFVSEYVKDYNGAAAWMRTFPETSSRKIAAVNASVLLKKDYILEAVKRQSEGRIKLADITAGRVMMEIARIAFSDARQAVTSVEFPSSDGGMVKAQIPKAISDIDEDTARAVQEIEFTKDGSTKMKLHPKMPALQLLARMTGALPSERKWLDKPPTELPSYDDDQLGDDELAALMNEIETEGDGELIDMDDDGDPIIDDDE